ncbi:MAG: hypothetical protein ABW061_26750, partial [Polyangiaceae bacterium]
RASGADDTTRAMTVPPVVARRHRGRALGRASCALLGALLAAVGCHGAGGPVAAEGGSAQAAGAASDSGSGGAAASGNGGPTTAMWTTNGSKYSLKFGVTYFEVDASLGGRITSFKTDGAELLADAATTQLDYYWGSTFWPSPQSLFNLPPTDDTISNIDQHPYTAQLEGNVLTLTSALNLKGPLLVVTKKFSADVAKEAVVVEYTMTNGGSDALSVAPWEITRVAGGGLTFYPENSPPELMNWNGKLPPTTLTAGVRWYQQDISVTDQIKFYANGKEGWLSHLTGANQDLLLIKAFPDIQPEQSPAGESEIEIYAVPTYVEVEQQGALQTLAAGESSAHWTVRWYARKLAAPAASGSADLVTYVRNQIK